MCGTALAILICACQAAFNMRLLSVQAAAQITCGQTIQLAAGLELQEAAEDFLPNLFEDCQDIRTVEIGQGGRLRMGYVGAVEEDGQLYYQIVAQALSGQQVTLITVSFDEAQARDELMAQLGRMRAVGARTIEEKTYDASEGEDVHG